MFSYGLLVSGMALEDIRTDSTSLAQFAQWQSYTVSQYARVTPYYDKPSGDW